MIKIADQADENQVCGKCGTGDEGDWISCDSCKDWHHRTCTNLSPSAYKVLERADDLMWFCEECKATNEKTPAQISKSLDDRMDKLMSVVELMQSQMQTIVASIDSKIDEKIERKLNEKLATYAEKAAKGTVENQQSDEQKAPIASASNSGRGGEGSSRFSDREELEERRKRERNIVIFGIPEDKSREENLTQDSNRINETLGEVTRGEQPARLESFCRLGKKGPRPRPLRITMKSVEEKRRVLTNCKRLADSKRECMKKVFLSADLTQHQRDHNRKMRAELKDRKDKGEDVVIYRGKIVQRQPKEGVEPDEKDDGVWE